MYGKINEYIPKWHTLLEMQSNNLTNSTPGCTVGANCSTAASGTGATTTMFREAYIDVRPIPSIAPHLNLIRMGVFRMPFGIFTEQSGGLRDVISSPYLNSVGSGTVTRNGSGNSTVGTIDFIQERDYFVDVRGTLFHRLDYVAGIMNNNNFRPTPWARMAPKSTMRGPASWRRTFHFSVLRYWQERATIPIRLSMGAGKEPSTGMDLISAIRLDTFPA